MSTSLFAPVKREPTRDILCAAIRDAIFNGQLKIGQRLREVALAEQFRVSRPVVREALQQLGHEGLIEINSFRGAQVVDMTPEQVDETLELRLLLEPEAVRLAKKRLTDVDRQKLRAIVQKMRRAEANSRVFAQLDFEFHEMLWRAARNQTLLKHLTLLTQPLFAMGTIMRRSGPLSAAAADARYGDHRNLVETICDGAESEAVEAMRNHIRENWTRTRAAAEKLHQKEAAPAARGKKR
jgi:DNA-binding GntR family transcriptional regulator